MECAASCPCRFVPPIADPCACGLYARGTRCPYCEIPVGGTTKALTRPMPKSKDEDLAEWDRKMAEAVAKVPKVNPRGGRRGPDTSPEVPAPQLPEGAESCTGAGSVPRTTPPSLVGASMTSAEAEQSGVLPPRPPATPSRPKGRRPRKARRSAIQLQRAAEQEQREAMLRVERATRGTYLEGALEDEDRWAASLRDAGND